MKTIVGINCLDFECVKKLFDKAVVSGAHTIQIDVADGRFAPIKTWDNPGELTELLKKYPNVETEIHLMAEEPEKVFESWVSGGAKKLVVHIESAGDLKSIRKKAEALGVEIVWGIKTETPVEELDDYLKDFPGSSVQILAVSPGFSDQVFNRENLKKISFLKSRWPGIEIRVDGGMNPETAKIVKTAGADTVVSVSFISESDDAAKAYQKLLSV